MAVDVVREAKAVAFLAAVRKIGTVWLHRVDEGTLFLQFELKATSEELAEFTTLFPDKYTLQQMFSDFGPELLHLLAQEDDQEL